MTKASSLQTGSAARDSRERRALSLARCTVLFLPILLLSASQVVAQDRTPGETYFGRNQYVEYLAGNLPVILSAPHGGREKPDEIPNRTSGTFAYDRGTQEAARQIAAEFHSRTGGWPHVVICRLQRTKVDCNREIVEAAAGNLHAEQAWREYQGFLDEAREKVVRQQGRGLFIDLHGHGHAEQRLELGYLHTQAELQATDEELDDPRFAAASSLRAIAALNRVPYSQLVRGELSFGALMEKYGFPSTPSPSVPKPKLPYFRGGHNTRRHGHEAVPVAGLQIETYSKGVRDTPESRERFAKALYETVAVYLDAHLGVLLRPAQKAPMVQATASAPVAPVVTQPKAESPRRGARIFRRRAVKRCDCG